MADEKKLTPKQEAFARFYVETGNASEAYRRAYDAENMSPETIKVKASQLLAQDNVAVTVRAIQGEAAQRHDITLDKLTFMAMEAYQQAKDDGSAKGADAMVKAVAQISRMHGFDVKERDNKRDPFEDMDARDRKSILDAIDAELGRRQGQAVEGGAPGQAEHLRPLH